jgi:hypothetical protein
MEIFHFVKTRKAETKVPASQDKEYFSLFTDQDQYLFVSVIHL